MIGSAFGRYLSPTAHDHEMPCRQGDRVWSRGGCSRAAGDWPAGGCRWHPEMCDRALRRLKILRDHGESRAGAGALVMERLMLQERRFKRLLPRPRGRQRDREYPISRPSASLGHAARWAAIM